MGAPSTGARAMTKKQEWETMNWNRRYAALTSVGVKDEHANIMGFMRDPNEAAKAMRESVWLSEYIPAHSVKEFEARYVD
jgi:hypothetical protein